MAERKRSVRLGQITGLGLHDAKQYGVQRLGLRYLDGQPFVSAMMAMSVRRRFRSQELSDLGDERPQAVGMRNSFHRKTRRRHVAGQLFAGVAMIMVLAVVILDVLRPA